MFDGALRPIKEKILIPAAKLLGRYLSPNKITLISLGLGVLSIISILLGLIKVGLVFWVLNRITDGLDGTVARVTERQSDFGGYIDILADFVIYSFIPVSFVIYRGNITLELILLAVMLSIFYINAASWMYLSSILEKNGKDDKGKLTSVIMPTGIVEGFETIVLFTLFYIFPDKINLLFSIMSLLTLGGTIQRIIWAYKKLDY